MGRILHATNWNGDDRTLCGDADDSGASGDADEDPTYAEIGERVTCLDCRRVIDHVHGAFATTRTYRRRV